VTKKKLLSRRNLLIGGGAALLAAGGAGFVFRKRIKKFIAARTVLDSFRATPRLVPHDPGKDRTTIYVAQGGTPAANIDTVMEKMGGIGAVVGADDIVIIKVSAQWWNQGMTNVAAVKRTIEHIVDLPGFTGDVIVFENTHFRLADGNGLARAFTRASDRNVDVEGMTRLGDLAPHFAAAGKPVSFVGLIDAGTSALTEDPWFDPAHDHGKYGGDGRGPIQDGEDRDGYFWDFGATFRLKRSRLDYAQTPLTWPRFTCPRTQLVIDLKDGAFRRDGGKLVAVARPVKFINMTTGNEHGSTGFTGACKSSMGLVDMSAGELGTDPRVAGYQSIHYFGRIGKYNESWRMAGPLAFFCDKVRKPDLYLTVMEWTAITPTSGYDESDDMRHHEACAVRTKTIVAGKDPVAIDHWAVRNVVMKHGGLYAAMNNLDDEHSKVNKFLRYYRQVAGFGTLDPALVTVV
jgi:hypothetical protein